MVLFYVMFRAPRSSVVTVDWLANNAKSPMRKKQHTPKRNDPKNIILILPNFIAKSCKTLRKFSMDNTLHKFT